MIDLVNSHAPNFKASVLGRQIMSPLDLERTFGLIGGDIVSAGDRGPHAIEALETIVHLFKIQGRFEEARRLIRDSWTRYPDRIGVLKELAQVDSQNPYSLDCSASQ